MTTRANTRITDPHVPAVLRELCSRTQEEEAATERVIELLGELSMSEQRLLCILFLYGREHGRTMPEMLLLAREAYDRHADGQPLTNREIDAMFEALAPIRAYAEAR